ncbi:serine hydrolase [Mycobacterium sp. GA-2829]|uniref:serine hydrolase domain-containing protein n=1 Tax=Mycobacterium sp. GA-2829 TaxID=1772283 RepID=UPI0007405202|nr:serine hydrolase domain-containing protein [Mycobacterium sp. GA-2829]KUI38540.1 D-alanyl-D-alanine carboxypeptidase [Mycobacterium sp. GA-2829]
MFVVRTCGSRRSRRRHALRIATVATGVAVLVAACTSPSEPALRTIDPRALQQVVQRLADELTVPGAFVLVHTPQGRYDAAAGTTEVGTRTPPTAGTHFRIASNTKTFTAALIVLLAQDGRIRFTDPVTAYVPDVPNGENITVADLLTMRSGLYGYTQDPSLAQVMDAEPAKSWTPAEVLAIAYRHPPQFPPDTAYEYSNTNYALLGLIAEKAGGRTLSEQFRDRLFEPVGLTKTSLPAADDTAMPAPYSHGYMYGGSFYALADDPYPAEMQAAARAGTLKPVDYTNQNPSYATAAGGAISTADDLSTWMKALVTGEVFDDDHHRQWTRSLRPEDPDAPGGQQYGYGISYQRFAPRAAMYYHGGELPGFNSFMGYDPDNEVSLVIWTNLTLSPDGRTTAQAMLAPMLEQIYAGLSLG